jgi:hypothetical protein
VYYFIISINQVEKSIPGAASDLRVGGYFSSCSGVWIDIDTNIYISEAVQSCIIKWSAQTNQTMIVAGQKGSRGSDESNHRIRK